MKYRLIEKTYDTVTIDQAATTEWVDVGGQGCDSIAYVLVASNENTPDTATITLQASLDKTNVVTVGSAVNVTADGVYSIEKDRPAYRYYRIAYAIASGSYDASLSVLAKGDKE